MSVELTADQAAQRLLTLIETLNVDKPTTRAKSGKTHKRKLEASSISWAFHDSVDTTGFLKWLVENIDATKNGITEGELELLAHLERISYDNESGQVYDSESNPVYKDALSGFVLSSQENKTETRIGQLETYAETIRSQGDMLTSREDQMARELHELLQEEERLKKSAKASDSEVARLSSTYIGVLDEANLAAKTLMSKLQAEPSSASNAQYFYHCTEEIGQLGIDIQAYLEQLGLVLKEKLTLTDELSSPWKEFQPFTTQRVSDLLWLGAQEHQRITESVSNLVFTKFKLDVSCELIRAISDEVDKMRSEGHTKLFERCQLHADNEEVLDFGAYLELQINENTEHIATAARGKPDGATLPVEVSNILAGLNTNCNELAQLQSKELGRVLDRAEMYLKPLVHAVQAIMRQLSTEKEMLRGWTNLWSTVTASLDKENEALEKQKTALLKLSSQNNNTQIIAPDDLLALAIKRLLTVSNQASRVVTVAAESTSNWLLQLPPLLEVTDYGTTKDKNSLKVYELQSRLGESAFTGWDALLADAKLHRKLGDDIQGAVKAKVKEAADIERKMDCSLVDLTAAIHGGDEYAGSEAVDVLPTDVRDALGEIKHQASILRKRVTKAAMLAEEPKKAIASEYASLFCQYY
ncbi:hypothetical protein COEREDRAFT_79590 [Coemansia reversa NRRL 1564]|uniref:Uncharacterized protein n=1 Tax=Coemansia reversa (strain ATCC 12441 / NRRL 1564) TaxID=763665 RepID=A0A2G5BHN5_COERN|nr:hypothetical protein COEREDRAFT_79590 [Coemansia reversa NRRL 1564]|eukprot:PIA18536.1 hypothetical protein COEREDRAFT_79590 [Coemansia reversa NRRL 1564]